MVLALYNPLLALCFAEALARLPRVNAPPSSPSSTAVSPPIMPYMSWGIPSAAAGITHIMA